MTNPTTPFSWQMPTSTDLVTDLPADFETFGQAVATSMADLLGGTTGQVLSKASNTDMDFTWVAQDDSNAIQNAIVDAKGDLITATAADTPARLAVGTNGQTLVANSSTATGLEWQTPATAGFVGVMATGAAQSIATSTTTILAWNAENYDTNTFHDNSTNNSRITIPSGKAGKYMFLVLVAWDQAAGSAGRRQMGLLKNGVEIAASVAVPARNGGPYLNFIDTAAVGDYYQLQVFQDSGGSISTLPSTGGVSNFFSATYLGA